MQSFVDEVEVLLASGNGGPGAVSFRREKYVPKGGPDGGDGGRGGNVYFQVRRNLRTLSAFHMHKHYRAQNGQAGSGRNKHGSDGKELIVEVPPGTRVRDAETGEVLLDLIEEGRVLFLKGGVGGQGNSHFATARKQAPRYAQSGLPGTERRVRLELNLIADIGFVGFPNAGKSSLLKLLTAANPKIGNYPFTTKIPNLGVMHRHSTDIVLADIPGIIEGASQGAGLGLRFLKHILRTRALAFVLDASDEQLPMEKALSMLEKELGGYSPELLSKPRIVILNKVDIPEGREHAQNFKVNIRQDSQAVLVSATSSIGIEELMDGLYQLCQQGSTEEHSVLDTPAAGDLAAPDWMTEDESSPPEAEPRAGSDELLRRLGEEEW